MKASRKGKGKDIGGTITTLQEGFEIPYGEGSALVQMSELLADSESRDARPPLKRTLQPVGLSPEPGCVERGLSPRSVAPESVCVERDLLPRDVPPKLHLNETGELPKRFMGVSEEDQDLSALSAAQKTKLGLSYLGKPPSTMSLGLEVPTRDVESCGGILGCCMDTCPSPFQPRVETVPVCNVGDTCEAEMKSYGQASSPQLAVKPP